MTNDTAIVLLLAELSRDLHAERAENMRLRQQLAALTETRTDGD